jgi:hypothetical protein
MCLFWLVRSLGVRIFELRCLGVRYFGASLLGGSEFWVYGILASWVFGFSTLGSPALCVDVCSGSYGSSVFPWVAWHAGSCFSAVYDASTRLGTFQ